MEQDAKKIAQLLKVLANENRLLILCILMEHSLTVGEIAANIGNISQSALSQHLALMKAHGIVDCNKHGQNITYFIADHKVEEVMKVLKKYYCGSK